MIELWQEAEIVDLLERMLEVEAGELCPACRRSVVRECSCGTHMVCVACNRAPWNCTCIVL